MASPTPPHPQRQTPHPRRSRAAPFPWKWLLACFLINTLAGIVLSFSPAATWTWYLVLGGGVLQSLAGAGPLTLSRFGWLQANVRVLLAIVGSGLVVAGLAIALNYYGTPDIDQIVPPMTVLEVIMAGLGAIAIAAPGAIILAETADRLLPLLKPFAISLLLMGVGILGIGMGGLISFPFLITDIF